MNKTDEVKLFLRDRCGKHPYATVTSRALYEEYLEWINHNYPVSIIHFGRSVSRLGVRPGKVYDEGTTSMVRGFKGIGLKPGD